ncbi:AraC family transcriptional regulator [Plantactinospora solaniradicis]|uniref:AraC family transcriptional regulator n=1 Tax=Plantactinospora solaniradicis TaxID=1723736 RepID=A0ABW1K389_9ACTN
MSASAERTERFEDHALGRPYHAALVDLKSRSHPHSHRDYYEVMAVVAGDGEQLVSHAGKPTRSQQLRPGDLLLVRPRDHHTIVGAVRFYNVAFPATGWRTFVGLAGVDTGWDSGDLPPHVLRSDDRGARACAAVLERFHDAPGQVDLIRFWSDLVEMVAPAAPEPKGPPGVPEWLITATAAMSREDYLREGVPRLRALAHVSDAHLARSMRRYYGTTPTEFIADLRLRRAATLLATTTRTVADVAYACGFASASYFTRRFHEAHGAAPRQFRGAARHAFVPL